MAHLCLINPPGIKSLTSLQMHEPNPPLGLAYVAAAARQAGHRVSIIDATGEAMDQITPMPGRPDIMVQGLTAQQVASRIEPDVQVIGVSCMFSPLWPITRQILEAIHEGRPDLPIIAGGEHASAVCEHVLATSPVTVCVLGEGEETIVELLPALTEGGELSQVAGIALRDGDRVVRTAACDVLEDLDAIPLPAWDLLPIEDYIDRRQMNGIHLGRAMPLLGTRGCPFRCTFCSSPQMWTTAYRMREVGRLCDEIELYRERYGATDFHFQDLTAIVSKKWTVALCEEMLRRDLKITWQFPSGTRSEAIDDTVCRLIAAAGCRNMAFAPESGSAYIRKVVQKQVNIDKMMSAIRAALRHRVNLSCFFVVGFRQDTNQTLTETLRLVRRLAWMGVPDVGVAKFIPYPGSATFEELLTAGRIILDDDFFLSPFSYYDNQGIQTSYCDALTAKELHRWMLRLFVNFYALSFLRHPLRTAKTLAKALLSGREESRYAKWLRDRMKTRKQWRRAALMTTQAPAEEPQRQESPEPVPACGG